MDLIAFRVTMYKGILDSEWVEVNPLTVLVGKNESGKTSLLKALHKLNPYLPELNDIEPELYSIATEWPRARRRERKETQEVCTAKFQLSAQEKADLAQITERETFPDTVEVSRNYAGQLVINFEDEIFSDKPDPNDVDNACSVLPQVQSDFGDPFKQRANECLSETRRFAHEGRFTDLRGLTQRHQASLQEALSSSEPPQQIENNFISAYIAGLAKLVQTLEPLPTIQSKVHKYVTDHLPTFIYMDDYRVFRGTAQLDEIKSHQDSNSLTEEDKTFLTILNLSGLDLNNLVQLGQGDEESVEQRQLNLDDGAATLTKTISNRLRQRNYAVEYRADGQRFLTFVRDDHDPALIRLEERSKGFQWFFAFDLMFMHESEETFEGCVILLDEPGLHLHPEAQKDLLLRLEEYAKGNKLLYTTHLPFMIDLNHPDRIRVLKETDNGIVVTTDLVESPPEAKFVLQAALGIDASQSLLIADRNLVVEGVHDYYILAGLSNWLRRIEEEGLPEDVRITPGTSASEAVHVATLMIGQRLNVVALFDSDDEGRRAKDKLVKKWLTQYTESHTEAILLGDAIGASGNFELEDLFTEDFMKEIIKETYSKELAYAGVDDFTLQGEGVIWKRIESFLKEKDITANKGSIAKQLRNKLSDMQEASELPDETKEKAIKLFKKIREAFGEA